MSGKYTKEYKQEALRLCEQEGMTVAASPYRPRYERRAPSARWMRSWTWPFGTTIPEFEPVTPPRT